MLPTLKPGEIVVAFSPRRLSVGNVVLIKHQGIEKVKRISEIKGSELYVVGDNLESSSDSRDFGYISRDLVLGRVFWPTDLSTGSL